MSAIEHRERVVRAAEVWAGAYKKPFSERAEARMAFAAELDAALASCQGAVDLLREAWRYADSAAPGWSDMDRRVQAMVQGRSLPAAGSQ